MVPFPPKSAYTMLNVPYDPNYVDKYAQQRKKKQKRMLTIFFYFCIFQVFYNEHIHFKCI